MGPSNWTPILPSRGTHAKRNRLLPAAGRDSTGGSLLHRSVTGWSNTERTRPSDGRHNTFNGDLGEGANVQMGGQSQVLTIQRVKFGDGTPTGVLDPYRDPGCDCPVETTFRGRLDGDTIAGTFTTRGSQIPTQTGTWRVKQTSK